MISLNKNYQKCILFYVSTHLCDCTTIQSGHLKPPARTKYSLWKISPRKIKAPIIIKMRVVIQYDNSYLNLKNEDLWCGRLRRDEDLGCKLKSCYWPICLLVEQLDSATTVVSTKIELFSHNTDQIRTNFLKKVRKRTVVRKNGPNWRDCPPSPLEVFDIFPSNKFTVLTYV